MAKAKKAAPKTDAPAKAAAKKEKPISAAVQYLRNYIAMRQKDGLEPTEQMKKDAKLG